MRKFLIVFGLIVLVIGLLWPYVSKLPLGRLPGDIVVEREGYKFFFPLTTMVVISVVLSLIFWLLRK